MACIYGNCNDANCVAGDSTDVNGNPCDDQTCTPCGSNPLTPQPSGSPAVGNQTPTSPLPNNPVAAGASSSSTSGGTALGSLFAGLSGLGTALTVAATGQPVAKAGVTTVSTPLGGFSSSTGLLIAAGLAIVAIFVFAGRKPSA